jgi:hypothetical protein
MTRVLRRPMFRTGGSAEGITSGLDNPQLTASRPPYKRGRVVEPGGYQGDDALERTVETYPKYAEALKGIRGERRPHWPQFLTSMGLDLLTRPKAGNIFQQVAASAKGPYEQMSAMRSARGISEDKLSSALFGDVMDIEAKKDIANIEAQAKISAAEAKAREGREEFTWEAKFKKYTELTKQRRDLLTEIEEARLMGPDEISEQEKAKTIENLNENILRLDDEIALLDDPKEDYIEKMLEQRDDLETLIQYQDLKRKKHTMSPEIYQRELDKLLYGQAKGGRVGYQAGNTVMPSAVPAAMQAPGPTDQGQDDTVQDLSFEELRARLPQEITNDIVKLLSESKQALVDFANIRTQQDVNAFNQKYDVNLVVPQEV